LRPHSTGSESSLKAAKSLAIFDHEMLLATKSVRGRGERIGVSAFSAQSSKFRVQSSEFSGVWRLAFKGVVKAALCLQSTGSLSTPTTPLNSER
jgi:hypothetical protein